MCRAELMHRYSLPAHTLSQQILGLCYDRQQALEQGQQLHNEKGDLRDAIRAADNALRSLALR